MSPFAGVIIRQRQSSEMIATHCPVRSMGAAARGDGGAAVPPRACARASFDSAIASTSRQQEHQPGFAKP